MALTRVNPDDVFFTFSRLRPQFSCGRRVEDTLNSIISGDLRAEDLPPIGVLLDASTGHMFSLNNRRLYVFKALKALGKIKTVPVRIKPVPQTKRMKDKYTAAKCAKVARLMLEKEALEALGSGDGPEGVNTDSDCDNNEGDKRQGNGGKEASLETGGMCSNETKRGRVETTNSRCEDAKDTRALKKDASSFRKEEGGVGEDNNNNDTSEAKRRKTPAGPNLDVETTNTRGGQQDLRNVSDVAEKGVEEKKETDAGGGRTKYVKPARNMDDWTDSDDERGNKKGAKKKSARRK